MSSTNPPHNIDDLRTKLEERRAAMEEESRRRIALDVGLSNQEAIGAIKEAHETIRGDIAELKTDVKNILTKLGEAWFDRWLKRLTLVAVAAAASGVVWWLVQVQQKAQALQ